jgi:hypothetical protein
MIADLEKVFALVRAEQPSGAARAVLWRLVDELDAKFEGRGSSTCTKIVCLTAFPASFFAQ